jgi:Domain of unknown function (DUF4411)
VSNPKYLLDATVFIESWKRYYAPDVAPGFWNNMIKFFDSGEIASISKVYDQIMDGNDELKDWFQEKLIKKYFLNVDQEAVMENYAPVINSVFQNQRYKQYAKNEFAEKRNADAWLVAYSKTISCTLITDETFDSKIKRRVKIPNVCVEFDIEYLNTFDMLRKLGIKLY